MLLTLCQLGNFQAFLLSADFFKNELFKKNLSGIRSSVCKAIWIQIQIRSCQTVCQSYQQMTLGEKELMFLKTSSAIKIYIKQKTNPY